MDGVLYRGPESLPSAASTVSEFRARDYKVGFLTNNSGKTRETYVEKLAGHGIAVDKSQVMTSGEASARFLIEEGRSGNRAYVIGMVGLCDTLASAGFIVDCNDEGDQCSLVVIGWDKQFTFGKIVRAQSEILVNGAELYATNADPMFPAKEGRLLPGAGAMVSAVETAVGRKATVIGKPKIISLRYLLKELGADKASPDDVWVVGDRLDTDIACGNAYGAHTVCVTTGIASRDDAENATGDKRPDFIIDSLEDLPAIMDMVISNT